jgi:hypothetical protein
LTYTGVGKLIAGDNLLGEFSYHIEQHSKEGSTLVRTEGALDIPANLASGLAWANSPLILHLENGMCWECQTPGRGRFVNHGRGLYRP